MCPELRVPRLSQDNKSDSDRGVLARSPNFTFFVLFCGVFFLFICLLSGSLLAIAKTPDSSLGI